MFSYVKLEVFFFMISVSSIYVDSFFIFYCIISLVASFSFFPFLCHSLKDFTVSK